MAKRICMIAYTNYLSDARVRREAETLASVHGYSVLVLVLREENGKRRSYSKNGVEVRELRTRKYRGSRTLRYLLSYLNFAFWAFLECTNLSVSDSTRVFHVHNMPNFLVFAAIVGRLRGRRIVLDVHDTTIETYEAKFTPGGNRLLFWLLRREERACCALAHAVICVNDIQRDVLIARGVPPNKILVSMNVPDPAIFGGVQPARPLDDADRFRLVYFGTVARRLGVDLAVHAVADLARRIPQMEFHIIGSGDDLPDVAALIEKLGAAETVRLSDRALPLEDLVAVIRNMDLGVVPNRRNAATELMLPVKLLECVALGIPVVAPRLKAIQHYFSEDAVFYFEPEDVSSLSGAIARAFGNESLRKEKVRSAAGFLDKYAWGTHKAGLLDLYRRLLGEPDCLKRSMAAPPLH